MNLVVPRNNISELVLYIWKIIDLPNISKKDLLYKISFELFLMTPEKATLFINKCIKSKSLTEDEEKGISLTSSLDKKLKSWHNERKDEILCNLEAIRKNTSVKERLVVNDTVNFGVLLKAFSDKGTLNRAISVSDDAFDINEFDFEAGKIIAKISGSQKSVYDISIDIKDKIISHNCHDYVTKRLNNKKFCKHLTKLFLLLKEKNEASATNFLKELALNVEEWSFTD